MLPAWLERLRPFAPHDAATHAQEAQAARLLLELQTVTAAHEAWKTHLETWLAGASDRPLRAEDLCFDDRCELGRWLHGRGQRKLGHLATFRTLVAQHQTVHIAAANLVSLSAAGRHAEALRIRHGAYEGAARVVMQALDALQHGVRHSPSSPV